MNERLIIASVLLAALWSCGDSSNGPTPNGEASTAAAPSSPDVAIDDAAAVEPDSLPSMTTAPGDAESDGMAEPAEPPVAGESPTSPAIDMQGAEVDTGTATAPESLTSPVTPSVAGQTPDPDDGLAATGDADTFSDDFTTDSLDDWTLRHVVEGTAAQYTTLDIDRTVPGALTIVPTRTSGWFADGDAPLVFKLVTGDFAVEVDVLAESASGGNGLAPTANFNSAGLMARDPAGAVGPENHVMVNVGSQNGGSPPVVGSESKTTRESNSVLDIVPGSNRGRLILCRIGSTFSTYRMLDNETEWRSVGTLVRADLPETLQVGMVANGFTGPDLRAIFRDITLRRPGSSDDCVP